MSDEPRRVNARFEYRVPHLSVLWEAVETDYELRHEDLEIQVRFVVQNHHRIGRCDTPPVYRVKTD